jgi:adenylosuccinate lyase
MGVIWSLQNRYQTWLDVELTVCQAMHEMGNIPIDDFNAIKQNAKFSVERIAEVEETTKHDMIAFLTVLSENIGPASRWVHFGMTSSDVLDTATALQCMQSGKILIECMHIVCSVLKKNAMDWRDTVTIGRSHGIHGEPTSFGLKFALWYDEMQRNIKRIEAALENISVGKISGAMGNYAHLSPEVEKIVCKHLELKPVNIATQVIQRDNHAEFLNAIAITGTTLEKIAVEIRHLQRTEVLEVCESFSSGQKGSSAMPHKKNPIVSEQISGLARLLRSNAMAALENNALWHERDISHSSVERVILPDSCILLHYMLKQMKSLLNFLVVYPQNIEQNLNLTNGLVYSQVLLLKLAEKGMSREDSYAAVQKHAMACWETKQSFRELIENDEQVNKFLSSSDFEEVFSNERYMKNVKYIYSQVFS